MKLLIIDDAPEMLKAFRDILEAKGYEVHEAENGEEAWPDTLKSSRMWC